MPDSRQTTVHRYHDALKADLPLGTPVEIFEALAKATTLPDPEKVFEAIPIPMKLEELYREARTAKDRYMAEMGNFYLIHNPVLTRYSPPEDEGSAEE